MTIKSRLGAAAVALLLLAGCGESLQGNIRRLPEIQETQETHSRQLERIIVLLEQEQRYPSTPQPPGG